MIVNGTPVKEHHIEGRPIYVKREDLCCPYPGPSFSKMRGVLAHIRKRPEKVIGVLDTYHSKAGWAVAWACSLLGKECVNYWPRYKADAGQEVPRRQQRRSQDLGATLRALPAGRSAILYHRAKADLAERWPGAYLMPNALKLPETVTENAQELRRTLRAVPSLWAGTYVISISSGTVAAGILAGLWDAGRLDRTKVVLHMGYSRSQEAVARYIDKCVEAPVATHCEMVDEGYAYGDRCEVEVPFPCNPYYDAKAWRWLTYNHQHLPGPIVFWNIGS